LQNTLKVYTGNMKTVSLKLREPVFKEAETILLQLKISRNAYINEALEHYNKVQSRLLLAKQLEEECRLIREADYEVLQEMDALDDVID
jgi:hypothetical protein